MIQATIRTLCTILLLLLIAAKSHGQESPRFLIERIDVRNTQRVSPAIVVSESRLNMNRTYSEDELREAADRLQRLPFLLDAQFSLEKGSVRDAYVLVISVQETKPFFFHADLVHYWHHENGLHVESASGALVGFRWFTGPKGAVHVGIDRTAGLGDTSDFENDRAHAQVGYTHYDLFGTRAFATVNLRYPLPQIDHEQGRLLPEVVAGIPLTPRQTLTASYAMLDVTREASGARNFDTRFAQRAARLRWSYNTTNHPFFPTNGSLLSVTPLVLSTDGVSATYTSFAPAVIEPYVFHSNATGVELAAAKYWELSERNSISVVAEGGWLDSEVEQPSVTFFERETRQNYSKVTFGLSHSLWDAARRAADGESRIELNAGLLNSGSESTRFGSRTSDLYRTSVSWVRRNAWGTLRVGVGYAW